MNILGLIINRWGCGSRGADFREPPWSKHDHHAISFPLDRELQARKERRSIWQKGKQVIKAWEIEKGWSKQEILEAYFNLVTFRGELQGISAASREYSGKTLMVWINANPSFWLL